LHLNVCQKGKGSKGIFPYLFNFFSYYNIQTMAPRKQKKMMVMGAGFFSNLGNAIAKGVKGAVKGVKGINNLAKSTGLVGTAAGLMGNVPAYTAARALGYGRKRKVAGGRKLRL
jgi:hypothetical protein